MSQTFIVTAQRGSTNVWVLECAEVGAVSQTRRLDQAADEMREAIAYQAGLPENEVEINVVPILPDGYETHRMRAEQARIVEANARQEAAREARQAAQVLKEQGLPLRDIGTIMGISYQRAAQLVA